MTRRPTFSLPWAAVGAIAVIGGYWLAQRTLIVARAGDVWLPYAALALGGAAAGALMVVCAPLRPGREPLAAGILAVAAMAALFLVAPHPAFSWAVARSEHPWTAALILIALGGASAFAGAALGRWLTVASPGPIVIAALAGLVLTGALVLLGHGLAGSTSLSLRNAAVVAWPAATLVAGFATQAVLPERRTGACAAGSFILVAWAVLERASFGSARLLVHGVAVASIGLPIAYLGARLAWRWIGRRDGVADHEPILPAARAR